MSDVVTPINITAYEALLKQSEYNQEETVFPVK